MQSEECMHAYFPENNILCQFLSFCVYITIVFFLFVFSSIHNNVYLLAFILSELALCKLLIQCTHPIIRYAIFFVLVI